jgi:hypothetical protein
MHLDTNLPSSLFMVVLYLSTPEGVMNITSSCQVRYTTDIDPSVRQGNLQLNIMTFALIHEVDIPMFNNER